MSNVIERAMRAGRRRLFPLGLRSSTRHRRGLVGPAHLWDQKRRFQFEFLTARGLRPEHRLLDIGCGTLRGGIPLIDYLEEGHYTGVEARAEVLAEARAELADAGLERKHPTLIHSSDPARVRLQDPVDFAWAFMVLIHMEDEIVDACLQLVARGLTGTGAFYANVALGDRRQAGNWQGFPVVRRPFDFYAELAATHALSVGEVGTLAELGHRLGAGDQSMMLRFARTLQADATI